MNNVLSFPIVKRAIPMENNENPAVFGKRKTPPGTVRFAFDTEGRLIELKPGNLPGNQLLMRNQGSKGPKDLGFTGEFRLRGQLVGIYEVGKSAHEVFTKLADRKGLEKFKEEILKLAEACA